MEYDAGKSQTNRAVRLRLARWSTLLQAAFHGVDHRLLVGEFAGLQFRVDQVAVGAQLETAAAGRRQFEVAYLLFESAEQLARQTDGLRLIVSHRAVLEFQVHKSPFAHYACVSRTSDRGDHSTHYYSIGSTRRAGVAGSHA